MQFVFWWRNSCYVPFFDKFDWLKRFIKPVLFGTLEFRVQKESNLWNCAWTECITPSKKNGRHDQREIADDEILNDWQSTATNRKKYAMNGQFQWIVDAFVKCNLIAFVLSIIRKKKGKSAHTKSPINDSAILCQRSFVEQHKDTHASVYLFAINLCGQNWFVSCFERHT